MRTQVEWKVESKTPSAPGPSSFSHALAHLAGGLVREGDGQDALGRDPAGADQMGDAVGEDARLAASRPGQHQQRALGGLDGPALLGVQPLQYGRCRRLLHAGAHLAEDHFSTGRGGRSYRTPPLSAPRPACYSTVTLLARLRGWSTSVPLATATW